MLQEHPALRQYPLEKIVETYQLDIRPVFKPHFHKTGGSDLNPTGWTEWEVPQWEVGCWPKHVTVYGETLREAVSAMLTKLDT